MSRKCLSVNFTQNEKNITDLSYLKCNQRTTDVLTLEHVKKYIESFYQDIKNIKDITIDKKNIDDFSQFITNLQPADDYIKKKDTIRNNLNLQNENNQISLAFEAYMVSKNNRTVPQRNDILSDIHDGWALARLVSSKIEDNNLTFIPSFKISKYKLENDASYNIVDISNLTKLSQENRALLEEYLNYDGDSIKKTNELKNIVIKIIFMDKATYIRADQLKMMVPFQNLLDTDKQTDEPFYDANFSTADKLNNTKQEIIKYIPPPEANGAAGGARKRNGGSASCKGPVQTEKRVLIGGKSRVVYQGKRGGEYIKKGGEFMSLVKAIKGI